MARKKIVFLTGTRADFGKLKSLINITTRSNDFEVHIFVTGMHMDKRFGKTVDEVIKCGYANIYQFINHDSVSHMDRVLGKTIDGFSHFVAEIEPDIIVVHGDRPEALAGAIVGSFTNRVVVHIEGGELSGTIDESIRHAISKLAHVHMVANEEARKRLLQLGEKESSIYIIGSPDLDLMNPDSLPSLNEVRQRYAIPFKDFALCMFHPVTTEYDMMPLYAEDFFAALDSAGGNYVVIYPNNDLGAEFNFHELDKLRGRPNFRIYPSLRFEYFLRLLLDAEFIIGNSSAGVREAPYYQTTAINVGSRQHRRAQGSTIINCGYARQQVVDAIGVARSAPAAPEVLHTSFGQGGSDRCFFDILSHIDLQGLSLQKYFQELDV
jgi:UDP-N-acetylglucosamine 2-epimerase (hydrolysing)